MARTVITLNNPILKLADTEAGLATGTAFECQLTQAAITPVPVFNTTPATGCAPASQAPGRTGFQIDAVYLQDWTASGGGLSGYCYDNDGQSKWFSFALDSVGAPTVVATGQVYIVAGAYGGTFGDGSSPLSTSTWPCLDKPDIVMPALAAAASSGGATVDTAA